MTLWRALHAETLKMKRTIALWMVVVAPAVIVLLTFLITSQAPFSTLHRNGTGHEWNALMGFALRFWTILMMPLYLTLETALVAGLDHSENHWKSLLARPVPRWTLYIAKLIVVMAMLAASTVVLLCGILMVGAILPRIQSQVTFGSPVPWTAIFRDCFEVAGLASLALTIQHWISLRWRSFTVAVSAGIVTLVVGAFAVGVAQQAGGWPLYLPWALPMLVLRKPENVQLALTISTAVGLLVAAAGCLEFCRREVQ